MHIVENNGDKSGIRLHKFMDIELELGSDVLVPREETEILGRAALGLLDGRGADARVIDMCCGSGNLGLAIAAKMPGARVWSADLTDSTVATARRNADRLGLADRVTIAQGDLFGAFDGMDLAGSIDLVVCNPPYISSARLEGDRSELLASEPREAFDGGPYGLSIHQRLIRDAVTFLKPGGWLAFEFGVGQDRQVAALLARARVYAPVEFVSDAAKTPRAAIVRKLDPA
ncbi:HemK/PrmC family methyltransferase [Aminobacter sp. SR38]|jgi:release factor glutamine methyltransferase|uniref:N5-glutamine methyltransferase family protein n=1 Tax=Aminobacter sp. SR38 TaxID=2774562 RepID=UPI001FEDA5C8|nr:HemK/PrmC family methyltransferase [Aminobacter sp. SR38]